MRLASVCMFVILNDEIMLDSSLLSSSPQLLVIHRIFHNELNQLKSLPKDARLEDFLLILERSIPSFSLYGSFLVDNRIQNLQVCLSVDSGLH